MLILLLSSTAHADDIERAGDFLMVAMPAGAGTIALMHHDTPGIFQLGKSLAATGAVTLALKLSIDEERPDGGNHSFPSMHTAVTFNAAGFLHERYGWRWGVPAYAAAFFTGWSRVNAHSHYTHDVLAGTAIGILSGRLFTKPIHGYRTAVTYAGTRCSVIVWHE
jgi:membrane-associated phospholipid phosphatase